MLFLNRLLWLEELTIMSTEEYRDAGRHDDE